MNLLKASLVPEVRQKDSWTNRRFDTLATMITDRIDDPTKAAVDRYVGLEHLDSDSLTITRWGVPSDVEATKLLFRKGDIIFGRRRAYQRKLAVADFDGICSAHAMVLRAKPETVVPEYLPFFMQSDVFMNRAQEISVGSLSPTVNWKTLAEQEFDVPSLAEQRRIVAVLSAAHSAIDASRSLVRSLADVINASIAEFDARLDADELQRLSDVIDDIESGKSPLGVHTPAAAGEYGVLKVSAVGNWTFSEDENKRIPFEAFVPALEVQPNDFLIARANADPDSVGRSCVVDACRSGLMLSDKTWRLHLKQAVGLNPYGLLAWTKSQRFRQHVLSQTGGTDAKNISQARLIAGPCPRDIQALNELGDQVKQARTTLRDAERRIAKLSEIIAAVSRRTWQ